MWNRRNHIDDEKLDRLGDELLRAFEASEAEVNTAATSPFLYRRIRVRIEAEERRRAEERNPWFTLLVTARRAIPALTLLAVLAASWHWATFEKPANNQPETGTELTLDLANEEMDASLVGWNNGDPNNREEKR